MQNFVDTLAQGIQSPLAVPVSTKPAPQKEIVTNTLISENKIREVFGIKPDQKMDERLKSITQETLDAISNRGMKMIRYSDDARAGGIIYNINITEKGSTSPKAYEGKILFKYPDININKELTRASRLPETELKYASITNNSAIEYLEGRAIFMKDDIYAVDQNGVISKKNYIKLGEDLEIYNYTINGSRLDLSLYNTNTMDRSKRTLVV